MSADIVGDLRRAEAALSRVRALADDHDKRSGELWTTIAARQGLSDVVSLTAAAVLYGNVARRIRDALDGPQ